MLLPLMGTTTQYASIIDSGGQVIQLFIFDVAEGDQARLYDFYNDLHKLAIIQDSQSTITRSTNERRVRLELEFDTQEDFWNANGINHSDAEHTIDISRGVFFIERTRTIPNPWALKTQNTIRHAFEYMFGANVETEISYIFASSHRRTRVEGATLERRGLAWFYIFENYEDDIVIFDRFANTPIWYVIGVGATVIFMAGLWFILRRQKDQAQNNAWQNSLSRE